MPMDNIYSSFPACGRVLRERRRSGDARTPGRAIDARAALELVLGQGRVRDDLGTTAYKTLLNRKAHYEERVELQK